MASILGKLDELGNEDNGNNDVPDLLRKYVLGADENGKDLYDILDLDWNIDGAFYNDPNSITDAHDTVIYLNSLWGDYKDGTVQTGYFYIKYNNAGYKIIVEDEYDSVNDEDIYTTRDVIKIYEPSGVEGRIVEYSVDGTVAGTADWLVLYDNGDTVDMTPVELDNSWTYTLGYQDPAAIVALPTGSSLERAIWSYNHAVDTLNAYCETIVTNISSEDGEMVRSVGTGFGITTDTNKLTSASNKYSSTFLANNPAGQSDEGEYNERGLKGDMEGEQDVVRMSYFSSEENPHPYGYAATGSFYWLASRIVIGDSDDVGFAVRGVGDGRQRVRRRLVECHHWAC